METTIETNNNKVQIGAKIDPLIFTVISDMASNEDRTISNMVERLLKTNPLVAERLETSEAVAA